ncbi:MAG: hypothetical protein A2268_02910 [Candidatus Raymondbacteria bacterium RifOxyA12_full_50_37]|uniref:Carbohydrate kinase PfkB domain-containing protein n=1 Tax=Candidatus Raymondbacteria bacterium RIFOXYD12_FULL_49_13 TaxID=1817890 RepID=A0A1F7F8Z5_UNCRA|nr:MAG: hypothetical protein A2248_17015 [Candidatus Raymondbacteria bacterium RIFOXYA2_FULL_49_16]OGJ90729.1 MAG: hypothetical protein A2268_02910 [Candidatus Raymondbacteria bacterium RifOxyA12_full_50_37]OGJ91706.1 MAG: hypothetical protein A2350_00320 [Candidatus Raymondbacteria bacterium RifOxyB12_full_50_8]OGJ98366.1 MAG: hypothetical protein A2453_08920 [Candidatus Raymondbacteria bacterium RIFOXYC2_FULL_50_21]OGK03091.1 MAG: hypothetical protein A2519_06750 [Candidatus Raymondbacteria b
MEIVREKKLLTYIDLLAVNIDEAALLGGISRREKVEKIVKACTQAAQAANPAIQMTITNGGKGAYACEGEQRLFLPSLKVLVANTAGAGDAWLSGLLLGTLQGLPFISNDSINCVELARLVSAMSVMSGDTINFAINKQTLASFASKQGRGNLIRTLYNG